jgi:hypothetical protein
VALSSFILEVLLVVIIVIVFVTLFGHSTGCATPKIIIWLFHQDGKIHGA